MALSESTGEIILRAAQGLSRTLQVQQQMVQRQAAAERQQALEVSNLKAKNERDALAHEKNLLELKLAEGRLTEQQKRTSPEALKLTEEVKRAGLAKTLAQTTKILKDERSAMTALARDAMESGALRIAAANPGTDTFSFQDVDEKQVTVNAIDHQKALQNFSTTGSARNLALEVRNNARNLQLARNNPNLAVGTKDVLAAARAQVNSLALERGQLLYLQDKMFKNQLEMTDNQIIAQGRNPAEQELIRLNLNTQSSSFNLATRYNLTTTKIQAAFDNPAGNYSEVRRMFTGLIGLDDIEGKRELVIQAVNRGLTEEEALKLLGQILSGTP